MSDTVDPFAGDVIGRAADLAPDDYVPQPPPHKETVMQVPAIEQLERPSPKPFVGRPDPEYPDLDSGEPLYIPRFLVRRWGVKKFERSAYLAKWKSEADRDPLRQDPKKSPKRK